LEWKVKKQIPFRSEAGIVAAKTEVEVMTFQTVNASSNNEAITSITAIPGPTCTLVLTFNVRICQSVGV